MVVNVHIPAKAGLGIVFDCNNKQSVYSVPNQNAGSFSSTAESSRVNPGIRAHSEPANLSYQPEQYKKLQSLWEQASVIIAASSIPNRPGTMGEADDDDNESSVGGQSRPATGEIPNPSVVDAPIFKLLYNNAANLAHFANTKDELPFNETVYNRSFLRWVASKEAGLRLNYENVHNHIMRLRKEPTAKQNSPQFFAFFDALLLAHQRYVLAGARFLSYDLYMKMIEAYFGPHGDVGLLAKFPVTTPQAFEAYIQESERQMTEEAVAARAHFWDHNRSEWLRAETELLKIKNNNDLPRRYDQLKSLIKIFNYRRLDMASHKRANRRSQVIRRETRRKAVKEFNTRNLRHQLRQGGLHPHTDEEIDVLRSQVDESVQSFLADEDELLPSKLHGMKLADGPDNFSRLLPPINDAASRLHRFGVSPRMITAING